MAPEEQKSRNDPEPQKEFLKHVEDFEDTLEEDQKSDDSLMDTLDVTFEFLKDKGFLNSRGQAFEYAFWYKHIREGKKA